MVFLIYLVLNDKIHFLTPLIPLPCLNMPMSPCILNTMKRLCLILTAFVILTGCCSVGKKDVSVDPQHIYKLKHTVKTVDGQQTYGNEVVRAPYTP